jgi:hypothetical protein
VIPFRWTKALHLFHKSKSQQQDQEESPGEQNGGKELENKMVERSRRTRTWRGPEQEQERGLGEEQERGPCVGAK